MLETERCATCGQDIPAERYMLHARGLDGARAECPKQDLVEIAKRARQTGGVYPGPRPWTW